MRRSIAIPTLIAASVAVPYVATTAPDWSRQWTSHLAAEGQSSSQALFSSFSGAFTTPASVSAQNASANPRSPLDPIAPVAPVQQPLEGVQTQSLVEVLRFDVTKEWVYQRWPRKSTALSELDLYGVRVPLVTGTHHAALAGSLTYFFDGAGRVQQISFHGRTADTTELVQLVTTRYGLTPQTTPVAGEQMYELRRGEDVVSRLQTRPAPVLWATSVHESFAADLELQDSMTARPLPPILAPVPPLAKTSPPPASAAKATPDGKTTAATDGKEGEQPTGWSAWFPRSRASDPQIKQLDSVDLTR